MNWTGRGMVSAADAVDIAIAHRERQAHIKAVVHDQRRFLPAWVRASTWVHDTMVALRGQARVVDIDKERGTVTYGR